MNLFKGLHSYFGSSNDNSVSGSLRRLMHSHLYIWNIPAGSTAFVNGKWQRSNTTLRNVQSVCNVLNTQWGDRYMLVNFSPFLMELYESCRTGQIVDFATHSVENFALLLELFFTINKWLALGHHEGNEPSIKKTNKTNNNNYNSDNNYTEIDLENNAHCVVLVFLQEANAVVYPNYAAMIVACYLTFAGWNGEEEWTYPENQITEHHEEESSCTSSWMEHSNTYNSMTNANSFALADGNLTLSIVEQLIGIPRSRLHAASQESYVSCFQLLFIIPVLPNPHRLRLTRISLHDAPHLQHRTLGLQVESSGCEKFIKLFSDPTAWKYGDASTSEIYLDVNETLLGDFSIQLFDYDMVGSTTSGKNINHKNFNFNNNTKANERSLVQGTINSLNAHHVTTGSIIKDNQLYVSDNNNNTQETRWGPHNHTHTPTLHPEWVVTKSSASSFPSVSAKQQEDKKYIKTRLLRLALSTIFICQTTHRVRVKDMDYALANSLGDSFYIALHFDEAMEEVHDVEYVTQLSERVELSPQRIRASKAATSEAHGSKNIKRSHHAPRDYSERHYREFSEGVNERRQKSKYRQSLRSMRGRGDHLDEELDLYDLQNEEEQEEENVDDSYNDELYEEYDHNDNDVNDKEEIVYYKSDGTRVTLKELYQMYFSKKRNSRSKHVLHDNQDHYTNSTNANMTIAQEQNTEEMRMQSVLRHQSKSVPLNHAVMLYLPTELNMMEEEVRQYDRDNELAEQAKITIMSSNEEYNNVCNANITDETETEFFVNDNVENGDSPAPRPPIIKNAFIPPPPPPPLMMSWKGNIPLAPPPPPMISGIGNIPLALPPPSMMSGKGNIPLAPPPPPPMMTGKGNIPLAPPPPPPMNVKGNIPLAPPPPPMMSGKGNIPLAPPPPPPMMTGKGNIPLAPPPPPPMIGKGNIPLAPPPPPPMNVKGNIPLAPPPPPMMSGKGNIPLAPKPPPLPPPPIHVNGTLQHTPKRMTLRSSQQLTSHVNSAKKSLFSEQHESQAANSRTAFMSINAGPKMKTIFWKKLSRSSGIWSVDTISGIDNITRTNNIEDNESKPSIEEVIDEEFLRAMFEVKPVNIDAQRAKAEQEKKEQQELENTTRCLDASSNDKLEKNSNSHVHENSVTKSKVRQSMPMSNLFTSQRLQNLGITLKRLRMPLPKLITALIHCDAITLNEDQRSTLLAVLPSMDEFDALLSFYQEHDVHFCEEDKLSEETKENKEQQSVESVHRRNVHLASISANNVEEYLVYLYKYVRDCRERLQLWNSMTEMTDTVPRITSQLHEINHAVQLVSDRHGSLAQALRSIRALGNYVNRGTIHADAIGFKLESLGQLNLVKSIDGKTTTMLEAWILQMMELEQRKHTNDKDSCINDKPVDKPELNRAVDKSTMPTHNKHISPLSFVAELHCLEKLSSTTLSEVGQSITQMNTFMQRLRHLQNEAKNKIQWYTKRLPMSKFNIHSDSDKVSSANDALQHEKDETVEDQLPNMINETLNTYLQLTTQLALQYQQVKNDTNAMLIGYGEDGSGDETIIWSYLRQFVEEVQKCMDQIKHDGTTKQKLIVKLHPDMSLTAKAEAETVTSPQVPTMPKIKESANVQKGTQEINNSSNNNSIESRLTNHKHVDPTSLL